MLSEPRQRNIQPVHRSFAPTRATSAVQSVHHDEGCELHNSPSCFVVSWIQIVPFARLRAALSHDDAKCDGALQAQHEAGRSHVQRRRSRTRCAEEAEAACQDVFECENRRKVPEGGDETYVGCLLTQLVWVCVVYLLDELAQITEKLTENGLDDVARHLVKKLDHKSPIVKQKVRPHSQQERSSRPFEGF